LYFFFSKILAPFLNLINLLLISLLLIFLINFKFKNKLITDLRNVMMILFFFLVFFPIGKLGLTYLEKDFFYQKKLNKVDNILVLAGPENASRTEISNKLNIGDGSERLIASIKLAREFKNSKIVFLGGDGKLIKKKFNEVSVAKLFYQDVGFDLNRIIFIDNTRNTVENLKSFKDLFGNDQSNVLITSAFHMKRSIMIANKFNLKLIPYAVDFRSNLNTFVEKKKEFSILNYIQTFNVLNNLNSFNIFFRELLGILAFKIFF
jgi:uncharacterized SAM-binding protein YcdF (DUF218 family)